MPASPVELKTPFLPLLPSHKAGE